jgi:hypothetical protein
MIECETARQKKKDDKVDGMFMLCVKFGVNADIATEKGKLSLIHVFFIRLI